jgi:hypothetical protein
MTGKALNRQEMPLNDRKSAENALNRQENMKKVCIRVNAIVKIDILSIGKIKMNAKMKWRVDFETFYLHLLLL